MFCKGGGKTTLGGEREEENVKYFVCFWGIKMNFAMEETGCEVICAAPVTLVVKE